MNRIGPVPALSGRGRSLAKPTHRQRMKKIATIAGAVVVLAGAASAGAQAVTNPYQGDAVAAAEGRKLYHSQGCVACHGNNARGAVGPDLTDDEWMRAPSDEMIFNVIKNGRSGTLMSPFKDALNDEQIWQVVAYLRDENRKRKEAGELQ
jgi:mono/diheme cytochrome c family protein